MTTGNMMIKKMILSLVPTILLASVFVVHAQQPARQRRIGFLGNSNATLEANLLRPFKEGLRELGYLEGRNIEIEYRWAEGKYERFPSLIAELIALHVDLIVTAGTPASLAVKKVATSIPLVMIAVGDPVGTGLITSLHHPGGNITRIDLDCVGLRRETARATAGSSSRSLTRRRLLEPCESFPGGLGEGAAGRGSGAAHESAVIGCERRGAVRHCVCDHPQRATRCAPCPGGSPLPAQPRAHHGVRRAKPFTGGARVPRIGRGGRPDFLWPQLRRYAQARRQLR